MSKTLVEAEYREASSAVVSPMKDQFDNILNELAAQAAWIVSSMPRGGLQIILPGRLGDSIVQPYARDYHADDGLSWGAIREDRPVRLTELPGNPRYLQFLRGAKLGHAAAVPLASPVFEGYAGALHVGRSEDQPDFSHRDLEQLAVAARHLDQLASADRRRRRSTALAVSHPTGQWIFDGEARPLLDKGKSPELDDRLAQQMAQHVRHALAHLGIARTSERLLLPDSRGDFWTFRVAAMPRYPSLGDGAVVFVCGQPSFDDWTLLRPGDFAADPEINRMLPAVKFMVHEFHRGPTLNEIARTAGLSPFHFHRRFTELMGLTPKHLLLECQITQAKRELLARKKELREIAADCGFAHQSHFTSRFKQAAGLTPTRWRRAMSDPGHDAESE